MKSPMRRCLPTTTPTRLAPGPTASTPPHPEVSPPSWRRPGRGSRGPRRRRRRRRRSTRRPQHPPPPQPRRRRSDPTTPQQPTAAAPTPTAAADADAAADAAADQTAEPVEARRLEQHFVYNSLNAIASLIRTDPARARELLVGFADLSRATDRPADTPSTLGHELAVVRDYLALEQARFGKRLRVEIDVDPALHDRPRANPCTCSPPCATPCSATSNPAPKVVCSR